MIENLTATNSQGLSITFDESFRVTSGLDLSGLPAQVNSTATTGPGSRYQNTRLLNRNLDLEFQIRRGFGDELLMDEKRALMYRLFSPENPEVRFDFNLSDGKKYYFIAHTAAAPIMPPSKVSNNAAFQMALVQMTCTDPYIYQDNSNNTDLITIEGGFIFPLEIPEGVGIEMGRRTDNLVFNIVNEGTGPVGMEITYTATGDAVNPRLINVDTGEQLKLFFTIRFGDIIKINTSKGHRSIRLTRDGVEGNIFNTFDFVNSTFMELRPGDNLIRYDADSGIGNLEVSIDYKNRYVGV